MPPDDRNSFFKDEEENEEDLFKKYSIDDNDSEEEDYFDDNEDRHYKEDDQLEERDKLEDEFFSDSDFEFKEYVEEEDEDGFRSTRIKKRKRRQRLIITTIVIMSVLVLVAIGIVFGYRFIKNKYFSRTDESTVSSEEAIVIPSSIKLGRDMNIVIACAADDLLEPDINSIMLSDYTGSTSELVTLCIPVNTLFEIPGFGLDNIGRSVEYGGPDLLKLALQDNLGMDIESYLLMDIINTVNKLESVTVNLDEAVTITSESGSTIELSQGSNILNGETAYSFLKYYSGINPDTGVSGIKEQKAVVDAVMRKIVGTEEDDILKNLTKISDFIDTDLNLEELAELISTIATLGDDKNKVYPLDGRVEPIDESGTVVFIPDISGLSDIFKKDTGEITEETVAGLTDTVTVTVLNGVGIQGIAGQTSELLSGLKFSDGTPRYKTIAADADNYDYAETRITVKSLEESLLNAADHIRDVMQVGTVSSQENSGQETDIVVIIGKDFDYDAALASLEEPPQPPAGEIIYEINILNGEGTSKLAVTAQGIIEENLNQEKEVIDVKETKNADNWDYSETEILIHTDKDGINEVANEIKNALGVGVISESADNPDNVDITVILGSDFTK